MGSGLVISFPSYYELPQPPVSRTFLGPQLDLMHLSGKKDLKKDYTAHTLSSSPIFSYPTGLHTGLSTLLSQDPNGESSGSVQSDRRGGLVSGSDLAMPG